MSELQLYIQNINKRYKLGNATEHTFRGDLQELLESLLPGISVTNEPKRQKCGAPDYILTKNDIPIGFIEAKDIGDKDLEGGGVNRKQFNRYKASLHNLIFTDYINFYFYRDDNNIETHFIQIAEVTKNGIKALPENFKHFENAIKDFCNYIGQTIKSPEKLAKIMAAKAKLLSEIVVNALLSDEENEENSSLKNQMDAFKTVLLHDITPVGFADIYAQTLVYGMFAARVNGKELDFFTRQKAAELIPKSNPFLRKLFANIAGPDIDDRIKWIVDSLADVFLACDVQEIFKNYGTQTQTEDPVVHFYETFLGEYNPVLRKARGVWYTPKPIVNFIVRAVDDILKTEFNLPQGLADISKTVIKKDSQVPDKRSSTGYKQIEQEVHKVQILDPATGTGTFLAEVIKLIYKKFTGQEGIWNEYVEQHLKPRLIGFEILMASYAMAHLKLDLILKETGFESSKDSRLKVYLTNSLEEHHPDTGTLWVNWLSSEANEANYVKRDTPVMCIIGNPPYSVSSTNKGEWIQNLLEDYKKDLNERNIQPLSDDYIKFIRYGQYYIEKNGEGVLAYISNNSFIDGIIHRQMRKNMLESFDKIYIIDLHGNSRKLEISPDGSIDQNVFDIMQGVSINIFVKTGKKNKNELGKVYATDFYGKREDKYEKLNNNSFLDIEWRILETKGQYYFFTSKDLDLMNSFNSYLDLRKLFPENSIGIVTGKDDELVKNKKESFAEEHNHFITKLYYRPFDIKYTIFDNKVLQRARYHIMKHYSFADNCGFNIPRQSKLKGTEILINKNIVCKHLITGETYNFPLYLYPETDGQQTIDCNMQRTPNLNFEIIKEISAKLNLQFTNEKETSENTFAPIDLLDYIYAVLHSPSYRKKYKEFLKIDFPRVPYPNNKTVFWQLVKLGCKLRKIHLLESPTVDEYITTYPVAGDNIVKTVKYEHSKVYINDSQYFDNVPTIAWEFYIGGYQPAQKWLKDRKGQKLEFEDILHYQKIIVALFETDRLMKEIDKIDIA